MFSITIVHTHNFTSKGSQILSRSYSTDRESEHESQDDKCILQELFGNQPREVSFVHMNDGTEADYKLMGKLYDLDMKRNLLCRVLSLLDPLKGVKNGAKIDLYEHSLQVIPLSKWFIHATPLLLQYRQQQEHMTTTVMMRQLYVRCFTMLVNLLYHKIMARLQQLC
jgi:hypothetical protein